MLLRGVGQTSVGKLVHTTNAAFSYVRPWVLGAFSAGLLAPRGRTIYARATPSECPYLSGWDRYGGAGDDGAALLNDADARDALGGVMSSLAEVCAPRPVGVFSHSSSLTSRDMIQ